MWAEQKKSSEKARMKWLSWLSVCQTQHSAMLMAFVCVFEVSVVYRYVVNSREVGDAMSSIANLCM